MSKSPILNLLEGHTLNGLDLLTVNVNNCPAELWDKKCGGLVYWRQIYHAALYCTVGLKVDGLTPPKMIIDLSDMTSENCKEDHSKETVIKDIEATREYVKKFYSMIDDSILTKPSPKAYWPGMTYADMLMLMPQHIMYHVGHSDGYLRDHGAKPAM